MRHVTLTAVTALAITGLGAGHAFAAPFEPGTIPEQVDAIGHLDVDALRKTQIFGAVGGQAAIDAALDEAPPQLRPVARTVARSVRGISFWRGSEHGAIYLETRDGKALGQVLAKLPARPAPAVDGWPTYTMDNPDKHGYFAAFGDTLVLADSADSLATSIHVLGGKAASLAGSSKLPVAGRQGVFMFVTIGDDLLGAIQKSAHARMLQLAIRSLVVDVGEVGGLVTATAHAEMRSADALQKGKSILDGLQAMASLSSDPAARTLLDGVTVTAKGTALEVVAKLPAAEIARLIQATK
jgi:hypothetical protein